MRPQQRRLLESTRIGLDQAVIMNKKRGELVKVSKFLSLVLRHDPKSFGLSLDEAGWANVEDVIRAANRAGRSLDLKLLQRVVHENDKQRFAFSSDGNQIRANQGHSIDVNLGLQPVDPPALLYHGTVAKFLDSIKSKGLVPGNRQFVHLSSDIETATIVGKRRGQPVILEVEAARMSLDSHEFYLSENQVWLVANVPADYITFP